ncbi:MAG: M14 family metallopeptidase [Ignavibacteriaceae bacterium]|nr:M14 family metallopeptidase [Ignavibacteriaceae bacterium]
MKLFVQTLFFIFIIVSTPFAQVENMWQTKFEKSNYLETARYAESIEYFQKLADASNFAKMFTFGNSPQNREMWCIVISKDKAFTPEDAKRTGKPIMLIENGIHSGEIEGKDASMILLREILITKEKEKLLDDVILLVVPIFSVDAHERSRAYNRINQNGPTEMGWRTTAQNLNLNRDWVKADAPEMQAMLKLFSTWLPDFFIDTHTTDGADYQYNITYALEKYTNIYKETGDWVKNKFTPYFVNRVEDQGFLIAPYVSFRDWDKGFESGIVDWAASPRLSEGYAAIQNRPGLLIETHMLKPYKDRVFSTRAALIASIEYVANNAAELVKLNTAADKNSVKDFTIDNKFMPLNFKASEKADTMLFKGFKYKKEMSEISGTEKLIYTDEKLDMKVPYYNDVQPADSVKAPKAYLIPAEWSSIIDRITLHGIRVDTLKEAQEFNVTKTKFKNVTFAKSSYEGRHTARFETETFNDKIIAPVGTFYIPTNQRTVRVILTMLEPKSDDSFVKWGFFNVIFEQKEYFESYVMEKVAAEMLADNSALKKEFEKKLADDEKFKSNPNARLNFFYERSPYFDEKLNLYPVMRIE